MTKKNKGRNDLKNSKLGGCAEKRIVTACFFLLSVAIGISLNCASLFVKPVCERFGFSRTAFSLNATLLMFTMLAGSFLVTKLMKSGKIKRIMTVSALIAAIGYLGYAFSSELWHFYACSLIVGLGVSGIGLVPCSMLITNWFSESRGFAMGVAFAGSGFGGMLLSQLSAYIIEKYGFSSAYLVLAVCMAVISMPMTLFLVKLKPRKDCPVEENATNTLDTDGISLREYAGSGSFYFLLFASFLIGAINMGVISQIAPHLSDRGFDAGFSANTISIFMAVLIAGKVLAGSIFDRKGPMFGSVYLSVLFVVSMVIMIRLDSGAEATAFAVIFGLANPMGTVSAPYITTCVSGEKHYAEIYLPVNVALYVGMAAGPPAAALIYDTFGGYSPAFLVFAVTAGAVTGLIFLALRTYKKKRTLI